MQKLSLLPHWIKSVHIWSFSGPHFLAYGLTTERYGEYLSVFNSNAGKYGPEIFGIRSLFTLIFISLKRKLGSSMQINRRTFGEKNFGFWRKKLLLFV